MRRPLVIALASAALTGVAIGVFLHNAFETSRAQAAKPELPALYGQATWKGEESRAPVFTLRDQHGREIRLDSYRGRSVVLAFMDSLCKSECPTEARQWMALGIVVAERVPAARGRGCLGCGRVLDPDDYELIAVTDNGP